LSLVLVDTSVWARKNQPAVRQALAEAIEANAVAMVAPVMLELLRSARDHAELLMLVEDYEALHAIALDPKLGKRAVAVQAALARRGYHRGPSPVDLLTAAAAESVGAELWHCDKHFELIAQFTGQSIRRLGR
jgi:predicted nucleic acid-binding protein